MGGGGKPTVSETGYPQLNFTPKGAQIRDIYQSRIRNFTARGQYQDVNLRAMFVHDRENGHDHVKIETLAIPHLERPLFAEAVKGALLSLPPWSVGGTWG